MIFVALGTHEQPFERAIDVVARVADRHRLVIQHGYTPLRPDVAAEWVEFAPYEEILRLMEDASAVICHAGVGTILSALGTGKCPVVIPRLKRFGEHVDDHQLQITRMFADRQIVVPCLEDDDIRTCLDRAAAHGSIGSGRRGDLLGAVARATLPEQPERGGLLRRIRCNS